MERLIQSIRNWPGAMEQAPVWIPELRKQAGMPKVGFDVAILNLMRSGLVWLDKHAHPSQATTEELELFVTDGDRVYVALLVRLESIGAFQEVVKPGKRKRGRPPVPEHLRRVSLGGSVRLPLWIMEWLKTRGDMGTAVESALKGFYKLKEPGNGAL